MNAQAGPSRSQPPLHIDLDNITVDQARYSSPLTTSASSTAPSLSIHRSSTQSAFYWNGPQTPRTERLSLTGSEWSISEDDVVSFGRETERSISSVMLDDGKTGGWWVDLDKTPRASDTMRKNPHFPSRLSSLPKQHPFPTSPKSGRFTPAPPERTDDELVALPDDSPLIRPYTLDSDVPPIQLAIPPYNPNGPNKQIPYDQLPTTPETLAKFPVPHPISMVPFQPATNGPAPPIPPRRSSRRERSGQSSEGKKSASATALGSLGTRPPPPPPPPPRASSLRSASARAAMSATTSMPVVNANTPSSTPALNPVNPKPEISISPTSLSRKPRVRSRSAQLPVTKPPRDVETDRRPSNISLSSILEDEQLPDMEATPEGSWALRRQEHRLKRAKSQPRLRKTRGIHGPWRLLNSSSGFCCI